MASNDLVAVVRARQMAASGELRRKRLALNLTAAEVASRLGKTPASLSRWEHGQRRPAAADAVAWMKLLLRIENATAQADGSDGAA